MPYQNIERSRTKAATYIGWRASDGAPFTIYPSKARDHWRAVRRDTGNGALQAGDLLTAPTLRGISDRLAQSRAPATTQEGD